VEPVPGDPGTPIEEPKPGLTDNEIKNLFREYANECFTTHGPAHRAVANIKNAGNPQGIEGVATGITFEHIDCLAAYSAETFNNKYITFSGEMTHNEETLVVNGGSLTEITINPVLGTRLFREDGTPRTFGFVSPVSPTNNKFTSEFHDMEPIYEY
jgi:hypothetical protein